MTWRKNPTNRQENSFLNLPYLLHQTILPAMSRDFSRPKAKQAPPAPVECVAIETLVNLDLIERRKSVRPIPAPEAIEHNDEATWSTWSELAALHDQKAASASAMEKLRQLLRRNAKGRDAS